MTAVKKPLYWWQRWDTYLYTLLDICDINKEFCEIIVMEICEISKMEIITYLSRNS